MQPKCLDHAFQNRALRAGQERHGLQGRSDRRGNDPRSHDHLRKPDAKAIGLKTLTGPSKGLTNVAVNTENLLSRKGTALGLPAKIHLENAILGPSCYIGSDAKPVQINLTTGKDGALEGSVGKVTFNEEFTIIKASGTKLVNDTFTAPATSGCGGLFSLFVDPLVSTVIGVPSGAGENSATLEGSLEDGSALAARFYEE